MSTKKSHRRQRVTKPQDVELNEIDFYVQGTPTNEKVPYVHQREKINFPINIKELPWTPKQKEIIDLFMDRGTRVLFLKGVAGTSKTLLSMYLGLRLLNERKVSDLVLVRSAVESADSKLGYLPGSIEEKFGVYLTPFHDKFNELIPLAQIERLERDKRFTICPINYARGLHFSVKFICCDEFQNMTISEAQTLLTRLGEYCKVIICGDPDQSDLPKNKSGFVKVYDLFNNPESQEKGIFCRELTEDDVVRSELCKFITHKFTDLKKQETNKETNNEWSPKKA